MANKYTVLLKSGNKVTVSAEALKVREDADGSRSYVFAQDSGVNERLTFLDPNEVEAVIEEK
jgi:hypothetical protein